MSKTLESYNKFAKKYNDKFSKYMPYQEQIRKFLDFLSPKSKILDMGCGTGLNSCFFSDAGHNVAGFDFSKSMIDIAKENCPNGVFSVSTIQDYIPAIKFDGICLAFIIVHLKNDDVENLITRLQGLLNNNGLVYISFMTGKSPGYETTSFSKTEIFFNYFETQYIRDLFYKNGFSLEYSNTEPYPEADGSITEDVFLIFRHNDNHI